MTESGCFSVLYFPTRSITYEGDPVTKMVAYGENQSFNVQKFDIPKGSKQWPAQMKKNLTNQRNSSRKSQKLGEEILEVNSTQLYKMDISFITQ